MLGLINFKKVLNKIIVQNQIKNKKLKVVVQKFIQLSLRNNPTQGIPYQVIITKV